MSEFAQFKLTECPLAGMNLIEASAGTGKTYNIVRLFLRLLLEKGPAGEACTVSRILTVTFTRAAAEELREKIRSALRDALAALDGEANLDESLREILERLDPDAARAALSRALRDFDEAPVYTIHGFCNRVLLEHAFDTGTMFEAQLTENQTDIIRELVMDFWRRNMYDAPQAFVGYALEQGFVPDMLIDMLRGYLNHPYIRPLYPPESLMRDSFEDLAQAQSEVRTAWPRVRFQVEEILRRSAFIGILNKASYSNAVIDELLVEMDFFAQRRDEVPVLFDTFRKFTASGIQERTNKNKIPPEHPFFDFCENLRWLSREVCREMDLHMLHLSGKLAVNCRSELEKRKAALNLISYDDLLHLLQRSLRDPERGPRLQRSLRNAYHAALIDEFQDTDALQWDIFKTVFDVPDRALFLIGDPKQSIYSFRGADIHVYLNASAKARSRFTLTRGYRSTKNLTRAVGALFARARPFFIPEIPYHEIEAAGAADETPLRLDGVTSEPLVIWFADGASSALSRSDARERIMRAVTSEIVCLLAGADQGKALLGDRKLRHGDIAVIVRRNSEAEKMQESLARAGVRSAVRSDKSLLESREAEELKAILMAIERAPAQDLIRSALITDIMGRTGEELDEGQENEELLGEITLRFRDYRETWRERDFMRMFQDFIKREGVGPRLLNLPDGERRLTNLLHLGEVLHQEARARPGAELRLLRDSALGGPEGCQIRLESDEDAVQIVTVHMSKGLEYPVVFCPFAWSGSSRSASKHLLVRQGGEEPEILFVPEAALNIAHDYPEMQDFISAEDARSCKRQAYEQQLAEELRLFYVALTRAMHRCYLVWGRINETSETAPAYLFHGSDPARSGNNASELTNGDMNRDLFGELKEIAARAPGCIALLKMPVPVSNARHVARDEGSPELASRVFTGRIRNERTLSSYTSLAAHVRNADADEPDHDPDEPVEELDARLAGLSFFAKPSAGADERNIFTMPRGARTGSFFHSVFETLDYRLPSEEMLPVIEKFARQFGLEDWIATAHKTVQDVLHAPLQSARADFVLAKIAPEERLEEMEFYFPLARLERNRMLRDFPDELRTTERSSLLRQLSFECPRGFMKGYMDLVFRFEDKYYLLDWKSNHLGNEVADYHESRLTDVMVRDSYIMQYYIYLAALDRYLARRCPGYDYDAHLGGVLYVFLRGTSPELGPAFGIYRDCPERVVLEWFQRKIFDGGEQDV